MFKYQINENLYLRLPELSDTPALFDLFQQNMAHLSEWQDWPTHIQTAEDCKHYILGERRDFAEGKALPCVIVFQETLVGMASLDKIVLPLRKAELSYWIAEAYQGQGIVSAASRGLLAHGFEIMNLNRIALKYKRASESNENSRSRRVAEKLGFTREGVLRGDGMTRGQIMDMVMYSLLADEWYTKQT